MHKKLSDNQKIFVDDAHEQGLKVDYDYSGRGMYGKTCPCVVVPNSSSFNTKARVSQDSMGLDIVIYASR